MLNNIEVTNFKAFEDFERFRHLYRSCDVCFIFSTGWARHRPLISGEEGSGRLDMAGILRVPSTYHGNYQTKASFSKKGNGKALFSDDDDDKEPQDKEVEDEDEDLDQLILNCPGCFGTFTLNRPKVMNAMTRFNDDQASAEVLAAKARSDALKMTDHRLVMNLTHPVLHLHPQGTLARSADSALNSWVSLNVRVRVDIETKNKDSTKPLKTSPKSTLSSSS